MINQYIWIGIVIGVFFVGIGISYAIFSNTYNPSTLKFANQESFDQMMSENPNMMTNWMETMMQDVQFHDQAMDYMAKNPEQMNQWMVRDPRHVEEMSIAMRENHDFMMEIMSVMLNDPDLRLQLMGHMTENQESMEMMKEMMGSEMIVESEPVSQKVPAPGFEDVPEMIVESQNGCDPAYPDVCIPPYPPDLDCGEIRYSNFRVVGEDPHGFDPDGDGIGCEG